MRKTCSECEWYEDAFCDRYGKIVNEDDWCIHDGATEERRMQITKNANYAFIDELNSALGRMATLTGKAGYAIMKNHAAIEPEVKIITQMRSNLIQKYGQDGKIKPGDEHWDEFITEYTDFMNGSTADISLYQIDAKDWNDDAVYCETAQARDYTLVKSIVVRQEEEKEKNEENS